jgi:hypothetical protein
MMLLYGGVVAHHGLPTPLVMAPLPQPLVVMSGAFDAVGSKELAPGRDSHTIVGVIICPSIRLDRI